MPTAFPCARCATSGSASPRPRRVWASTWSISAVRQRPDDAETAHHRSSRPASGTHARPGLTDLGSDVGSSTGRIRSRARWHRGCTLSPAWKPSRGSCGIRERSSRNRGARAARAATAIGAAARGRALASSGPLLARICARGRGQLDATALDLPCPSRAPFRPEWQGSAAGMIAGETRFHPQIAPDPPEVPRPPPRTPTPAESPARPRRGGFGAPLAKRARRPWRPSTRTISRELSAAGAPGSRCSAAR